MRRHLHDAGAASRLQHLPHERLHVGRLRRGARGLEVAVADPIDDSPHQPAFDAGGFQDRADQVASRRLAVGSRDADHPHLPARVLVELRGQVRQRETRVGNRNPGDVDSAGGGALRHDSRRTSRDRLLRELRAVHLQATERDEHGPRRHPPRVERHPCAGLPQRGLPLCELALVERHDAPQRPKQLIDRHGPRRSRPGRQVRRSSVSTTVRLESSGVPGAGHWSTTRPAPRNSAVHPRRVSAPSASRALMPVKSGTSDAEVAHRAGQRHERRRRVPADRRWNADRFRPGDPPTPARER